MDLDGIKIAIAVFLPILKFISGLAPHYLVRKFKVLRNRQELLEKIIYGVSCIGGGVLICVVFVHMLPEARESLNTARKQSEEVIIILHISI